MISHQTIIDSEDRLFTHSIGHWTGDVYWESGFVHGVYGTAGLWFQIGDTEKAMSLTYPNIVVKPGNTHTLHIEVSVIGNFDDILLTWKLTDGIYSFQDDRMILGSAGWIAFDENLRLKKDFNKTSAQLILTATDPAHPNIEGMFFYNLSLFYNTKTDHLPLMGAA
jgi:hypothetical protein